MIVIKAARWHDVRLPPILEKVFREKTMPWELLRALRLAKMWHLRSEVEPYLIDKTADYREEARNYFRALEKATAAR